ncbi:MAG: hypothetical protein FK733_17515 [Asgard group archaeon]|nr:hypothetical protein [Asgard group archaeon]
MVLESLIQFSHNLVSEFKKFIDVNWDESLDNLKSNFDNSKDSIQSSKILFITQTPDHHTFPNKTEKLIEPFIKRFYNNSIITDISNELLNAYYETIKEFHPKDKLPEDKIGSILYNYIVKLLIKECTGQLNDSWIKDYTKTLINDLLLKPREYIHIYEVLGIDLANQISLSENSATKLKITNEVTLKQINTNDFKDISSFAGFYGIKRVFVPKVGLIIRKEDYSGTNIDNLAYRVKELMQIYYLKDIAFGNKYTFVKSMTYQTIFHKMELYKRPTGGRILLDSVKFHKFTNFVKNLLPKIINVFANDTKEFLRHSINRYCRALDSSTNVDYRLLYSVLALEPLFIKEFEGKEIIKDRTINITSKVKDRVIKFGKCWGKDLFKFAEKLELAYNYRNDIVHCNPYPKDWHNEFSSLSFNLLSHIRDIIIYYLYYFNRDRLRIIDFIDKSMISNETEQKLTKYVTQMKEKLQI